MPVGGRVNKTGVGLSLRSLLLFVLLSGFKTVDCDDVTRNTVDENNIDSGERGRLARRGAHRRHSQHASGSLMTSLRRADAAAMHLKDMSNFVIEDPRTLSDDDVMADSPLRRGLRQLSDDDAKPTSASADDAQFRRDMLEYRPQRQVDLETTTEGHEKVTTISEASLDDAEYLKDTVRILRSQLEESQNTQRITR